ncbi:hypothetical protein J3R30DRAFT_1480 [Lentinula aciculospora]|uniref:Uncharacterized protein n=1 Tax=Lentinula aciculospora TaxID=153920 RepID=A0A9W9AT17_9AGAR|nr:hypothetical protein J3R30DRAFT_1480 [Lentinula aciculospora]
MALALNPAVPPSTLHSIIILDISPVRAPLADEFFSYIKAIKQIEKMKLRDEEEAARIFQEHEKDPRVVQFLLSSMNMPQSEKDYITARIPVGIISEAMHEMGSFPYAPGEAKWDGKTMILKGKNSEFIKVHYYQDIKDFFPNMRYETFDTGHFIHAEQPEKFKTLVKSFILNK